MIDLIEFDARFSIPDDHPSLPGHFPGHPVVPGVVLLESVLVAICDKQDDAQQLHSIPNCKFMRAVQPGEEVSVRIRIARETDLRLLSARFVAKCADAPVAEGRMLLRIAERGGV